MTNRPRLFDQPMTPAERQRRKRALDRLSNNPEEIASRIRIALDRQLDGNDVAASVRPNIADAALHLIARHIAKRRKLLAPALAEYRRKQAQRNRRARRGGGVIARLQRLRV
jgi:hypothetical protein